MKELIELASRVAELERRIGGMMRHGTVAEVDPKKALMRLKMGEDKNGKPFLSPWVPYGQVAGVLKVHSAPSVGQQMTVMSPTGDMRQAVALPMTWSNQNQSPSESGEDRVITQGAVKITMNGEKLEVLIGGAKFFMDSDFIEAKVGGMHVTVSPDGVEIKGPLDIKGPSVFHNFKSIGDTHGHITAPPGPPGPPV